MGKSLGENNVINSDIIDEILFGAFRLTSLKNVSWKVQPANYL